MFFRKKLPQSVTLPDVINSASSTFAQTGAASAAQTIKCSLCDFSTYGTEMLFFHLATMHTADLAQSGIADNSSEASSSTLASDGDPMADIDIDIKPIIDLKPLVEQAMLLNASM
uniref:Uncharacterized protein n=1 Tax=Caenorhabditis japonica TaxID=281687 RepID=A0A8R1IXX8_CAEJA